VASGSGAIECLLKAGEESSLSESCIALSARVLGCGREVLRTGSDCCEPSLSSFQVPGIVERAAGGAGDESSTSSSGGPDVEVTIRDLAIDAGDSALENALRYMLSASSCVYKWDSVRSSVELVPGVLSVSAGADIPANLSS